METCIVCGKRAMVIVVDEYVEDHEIRTTEELYCNEHYSDFRENAFELPADRLAILDN